MDGWASEYLVTYDVQPDGTLKSRRTFGRFNAVQQTDKAGKQYLYVVGHGQIFRIHTLTPGYRGRAK